MTPMGQFINQKLFLLLYLYSIRTKVKSEFHFGPDMILKIFITSWINIFLSFFHAFAGIPLECKLIIDVIPT